MIRLFIGAIAAMLMLKAAAADKSYPLSMVRGSRLTIGASINGHPAQALLDSAAEATLLDRDFATQLNLKSSSVAEGQGSGETTFEAGMVSGVTLKALGLTLVNQTVAIVDLTDVGKRLLGRRIEVSLGREIFDAARLFIDIDAQRIEVRSRDHEPAGVRLGLVTEKGIETIAVRVEGGEPVRAAFDLGNGSQVLVGAKFAQRMHLLSGRDIGTQRGGGLGGETQRQIIQLRSLEIAGQVFNNVDAAIDEQQSAADVNIGVQLLRQFVITTDFANHAVWLQPRR